MNEAAAELLTRALPNLSHPGDGQHGAAAVPGVMWRTTGMNPEMAEAVTMAAKLHAEAVVHALEAEFELVPKAEATQLRTAAATAEPQRHRQLQVHCTCGVPLFRANVSDFDSTKPKISPQVIKAMQQLSPECAIGHKP